MRKLGLIGFVLVVGLIVSSCQKEDVQPNTNDLTAPSWENTMDRTPDAVDEGDDDIVTGVNDNDSPKGDEIVDPNNDGDGRDEH